MAPAARTERHTLGGATAIAAQLPPDGRSALLTTAQDALAAGFQLVAAIGGVIVILLAGVSTRYSPTGTCSRGDDAHAFLLPVVIAARPDQPPVRGAAAIFRRPHLPRGERGRTYHTLINVFGRGDRYVFFLP